MKNLRTIFICILFGALATGCPGSGGSSEPELPGRPKRAKKACSMSGGPSAAARAMSRGECTHTTYIYEIDTDVFRPARDDELR